MRFVGFVLLLMASVDVACFIWLWRKLRQKGLDTEEFLGSSSRWLFMAIVVLGIVAFVPTEPDAQPIVVLTAVIGFGALTYSVIRQVGAAMALLDLSNNSDIRG